MTDRARLRIWNDADRARAYAWIARVPVGWSIDFKAPTRSLLQNDRFWAMLDEISEQVDWYGQKLTSDEWKIVFSAALKTQRVVPGLEGGFVAIGQSTSQMTVSEMSDLMELMSAFGAERGVQFNFKDEPVSTVGERLRPKRAEADGGSSGPARAKPPRAETPREP